MKNLNSKQLFEAKNPYVLVQFETINGNTFSSIEKSFTNKANADHYFQKYGNSGQEVMTRKKYEREASQCL